MPFKKTVLNYFIVLFVKFFHVYIMNLNQSSDIYAFLIKPFTLMVQALYLLSLKLTLIAYQAEMTCAYA